MNNIVELNNNEITDVSGGLGVCGIVTLVAVVGTVSYGLDLLMEKIGLSSGSGERKTITVMGFEVTQITLFSVHGYGRKDIDQFVVNTYNWVMGKNSTEAAEDSKIEGGL